MLTSLRRFGILLIVAVLPPSATWAQDASVLKVEVVEVLRATLAVEAYDSPGSTPCRLDADWLPAAVPRDIAQKVFGEDVQADLVAPEPVPQSAEILAAVEPDPARVCSRAERQEQREKSSHDAAVGTRFDSHVWEFSFPVFDASFSKVVIIWRDLYEGRKMTEGGVKGTAVRATDTALIFVKRNGSWFLAETDVIGQT